jgi:hypothetical protein
MDVYLVEAPDAGVAGAVLPLIRDADGDFARNYDVSDSSVFVIRSHGYLRYRRARRRRHRRTGAPPEGDVPLKAARRRRGRSLR